MSELAGLVIGAVSLASLFDSVINNFDRIQVAREFDETYRRYCLQLEVLRLRLYRWHSAVSRLAEIDKAAVEEANGRLVERHLKDIQSLFEKEEKLSKSYKGNGTGEEEEGAGKTDWLVKSLQRRSRKHRGISATPTTSPSIRDRVRWGIRGKSEFERLVSDISTQVSNLEKIFMAHDMESRLDQMRIEDASEIGKHHEANIKDINILQEISLFVDQKFATVVEVKAVRNEWDGNSAEGDARLHQGDMVSSDYRGSTIASSGLWKGNVARGNSRVTQGTLYGFNPFS